MFSKGNDWIYSCGNSCIRIAVQENVTQKGTLETCNMLCGDLPLWPKPERTIITKRSYSSFNKSQIEAIIVSPNKIRNDLEQAMHIFRGYIPESKSSDTSLLKIYINVTNTENVLTISTDESYSLAVKKIGDSNVEVQIVSSTYFGARNGLETLSQLIWLDTCFQTLNIVHDVEINDKPKFAHRGLMVDTARNYFYIDQLQKVVDGMAATKLNVLHLHLTDATSFPIVLPRNELFAKYGAYDSEMMYSVQQIKDLVEYARLRGIRVVLEIDAPSHITPNLNRAIKDLIICGEESVFNGHLNPENNVTWKVLQDIYKDLLDLGTDNDMFHIGGDEVNLNCWRQNTNISGDMNYVWINFTNRMIGIVESVSENKLPTNIVLWSSHLTDNYLSLLSSNSNIVVQYWYGLIDSILKNGNKVILSTVGQWYLDCGYGSWVTTRDSGVCDPYTTWHKFYKYQPWINEFSAYKDQILGGEACLWSEMVEVDSLETRIWPRAAALAERLWTDPLIFERSDVYKRLDIHRIRLKSRGIKSEAIWPRWCSQNPGKC